MTPRRKRILIGVALAVAAIYGLDDLSARFGIPPRPQYSTVRIRRYDLITEKYNKFSYEPLPPIDEQCANALLPHWGARPCWWVQRHKMITIKVN
jgi:hypothetical protein